MLSCGADEARSLRQSNELEHGLTVLPSAAGLLRSARARRLELCWVGRSITWEPSKYQLIDGESRRGNAGPGCCPACLLCWELVARNLRGGGAFCGAPFVPAVGNKEKGHRLLPDRLLCAHCCNRETEPSTHHTCDQDGRSGDEGVRDRRVRGESPPTEDVRVAFVGGLIIITAPRSRRLMVYSFFICSLSGIPSYGGAPAAGLPAAHPSYHIQQQ